MQMEKFPSEEEGAPPMLGRDLPADRKNTLLTDRIKRYAQRVYKRVSAKPETAVKVAGVCQRENGFYVDTVLAFRDRRYEYKGLVKKWKKALSTADANVCALHFGTLLLIFWVCFLGLVRRISVLFSLGAALVSDQSCCRYRLYKQYCGRMLYLGMFRAPVPLQETPKWLDVCRVTRQPLWRRGT